MIKYCSCKNEYQDKIYGESLRVHNECITKSKTQGKSWRCTVCGVVKD